MTALDDAITARGPGAGSVVSIENQLITQLSDRLCATDAVELTEGGSPARLFRLQTPDGQSIVLKVLVDVPGAVDGHDLASFRVKIGQILKIRREVPELRSVYTDLCDQFHGKNWSAYTMPYYESVDIGASLRPDGIDPERFWSDMTQVLSDLLSFGYLRSAVSVGVGHINSVHMDRLARRFWVLRKYLPGDLCDADVIVINGVRCRNPLGLALAMADSDLTHRIDPQRLYYPVHGDLNMRNILVTEDRYRVIDPRGTIHHWDPAYDIAKLLFSLTVWDAAMRRGFNIGRGREWSIGVRGGRYQGYRNAASQLVPQLRSLSGFGELTAGDSGWESRVLLGHAFHTLAEAACRLSAAKKRTGEAGDCQFTPLELAVGHYLYGVLFLEDAVRQLEMEGAIDTEATLSLLDL